MARFPCAIIDYAETLLRFPNFCMGKLGKSELSGMFEVNEKARRRGYQFKLVDKRSRTCFSVLERGSY